jgi:hypothetical protein
LPSWEYFPFATNRTEPLELVESEHRQHAVDELVIRDLKDQALAHFPSGSFNANSAWKVIACLAQLLRWTAVMGLGRRTVRGERVPSGPGRVRGSGRSATRAEAPAPKSQTRLERHGATGIGAKPL